MPSGIFVIPLSISIAIGKLVDTDFMEQLQLNCAKSDVEAFLSFSERSTGKLYKKVIDSGFSMEVAGCIVEWAKEYDLVNDERFCRLFVSSKVFGIRRFKLELLQKGVPLDVVNNSLSEISEFSYKKDLISIINKRYGTLPDIETAKRRAYGWLSRRGFSAELIHSVLNEVL